MKIKKNDIVKVISGDFKGKTGKVLKVFPLQKKIIVENTGFHKKHIKSRIYRKYPEGGIIEKPKIIDVSNVMFYSQKQNKPFRLGYIFDKKKNKCRVSRGKNNSHEIIN